MQADIHGPRPAARAASPFTHVAHGQQPISAARASAGELGRMLSLHALTQDAASVVLRACGQHLIDRTTFIVTPEMCPALAPRCACSRTISQGNPLTSTCPQSGVASFSTPGRTTTVHAVTGPGVVGSGQCVRVLARHRGRLFPDSMMEDLFPSRRGRPSVPSSVIGSVLVLQALEGFSDRGHGGGIDVRSALEGGVRVGVERDRVPQHHVDVLARAPGRQ